MDRNPLGCNPLALPLKAPAQCQYAMDSAETSRPAFFEVYAANHLSSALRPAFRFALEVLSVRHPLLIRIAARSDEIFTGLLLILETSQLNKESALLGESFYSLKRSRGLKHTGLQEVPLSRKQLLFSVVFSVIVPHFKAKLDTWYSDITGGAPTDFFDESDPGQGFPPQEQQTFSQLPSRLSSRARHAPLGPLQKFRQLLKAVERLLSSRSFQSTVLEWYPYISTACESLDLLFNILYLFGHSRHFNLALALQGLVLRRKSTLEAMTSQSQKTPFFPHGSRSFDLAQVLSAASERLLTAFKAGFFVGVFAFRFLQYYYAAEVRI